MMPTPSLPTKVDEIMELARQSNDQYLSVIEQVEYERDLRTAIGELVKDAEQWQAYKARRDAVMAAGMGRNALRREQGEES